MATITGTTADDLLQGAAEDDLISGFEGNDTLEGSDGNDTLEGGDGTDSITGGAGNDSLDGGAGNDSLTGGSGSNTLLGGEGNDTLTSVLDAPIGQNLLDGGIGNDTLTGISDDTLLGGEGADSLRGGISLDGGDGDDTLQTLTSGSSTQHSTLIGGAGNDRLTTAAPFGNSTNLLDGGIGNDTLTGFLNDTLRGGEGDDSLSGGAVLDGGDGADTITGSMFSSITLNLSGGAGNDRLSITGSASGSNRHTLDGGDGADTINGSSWSDSIIGGEGDDSIIGAQGHDILDGGNGNDILSDTGGSSSDNNTLRGGAGNDQLIVSGGGNSTLDGGLDNDTIIGGNGFDSITGGDGNDSISGGLAFDIIDGGNGDDIISDNASSNSERNTLIGGEGHDRITVTGAGTNTLDGGIGNDTLTGSVGLDSIIGGEGNDSLTGGLGFDFINGGDGDDTIIDNATSSENNSLQGGAGNDIITVTGIGRNSISGGTGEDTITMGMGNDTVSGGADADIFVKKPTTSSGNTPTIVDFSTAQDKIDLSAYYNIISFEQLTFSVLNGNSTRITFSGIDNLIVGNIQPNVLNNPDYFIGINFSPKLESEIAQSFADIGEEFTLDITGHFSDRNASDVLTYEATIEGDPLPDWLTFDTETGIFSGTPSEEDSSLSVRVTATDNKGRTATDTFTLTVRNIIDGTEDSESLTGTDEHDDSISGLGGDDTFSGSAGNDTYAGGEGADLYLITPDEYTEKTIADFTPGEDKIDLTAFTLPAIEFFSFVQDGNNTLMELSTPDSGEQTLRLLNINPGDITADYFIGLVNQYQSGTEEGEQIYGSTSADSIEGNGGDDTITGGEGRDTLIGGAGNDYIEGANGRDSLVGDEGNDTLLGGGGGDDSLNGGEGDDYVSGEGLGGRDGIVGGEGNDTLVGDNGDFLTGGEGADIFVRANDHLSTSTRFNINDFNLDEDLIDISQYNLAGFSSLAITQSGSSTLIDFAPLNRMTLFNVSAASLTPWHFLGINHPPRLEAEFDYQQILALEPFEIDASQHFIDTDGDTITYSATLENGDPLPEWLTIDSETGLLSGTPANSDATFDLHTVAITATDTLGESTTAIFELEVLGNYLGTEGDDSVSGGDESHDIVTGLGGNDTLTGGFGYDTLYGGEGDDLLLGKSEDGAADYLEGGEGNDTLVASALGYDNLVGGEGADVFRKTPSGDTITPTEASIYDFTSGEDSIDLAAYNLLSFEDLVIQQQGGDAVIQLSATDSIRVSQIDAADLTIEQFIGVNSKPVLETSIADNVTDEDEPFTLDISGNFSDRDEEQLTYTATLQNGAALPAWLQFNTATGIFTGTPLNANVGTVQVKVTVQDARGTAATDSFALTVNNVNDAPVVNIPLTDRSRLEDVPFTFTVPASTFSDVDLGDVLTYTATQTDGSPLPSWLSFNPATRLFSGTPLNEHVGTFGITVTVTDLAGVSASSTFNLAIQNVNDDPIVLGTIANQSTDEDSAFSFTVPDGLFTDVDAGDVLTLVATRDGFPLPAWLSFDVATRTFSGTPANKDVGTIPLKLSAVDTVGAASYIMFNLTVNNTNDAPVAGSFIADTTTAAGAPFSLILPQSTFSDVDVGETLTLTATQANGSPLPAWLNFDGATRTFSGTPENADAMHLQLVVTATDLAGESATNSFNLHVQGSYTGTAGDDSLTGSDAADDIITGLAGNDSLNGGFGGDTLEGGTGNDTYYWKPGGGNTHTLILENRTTENNVLVVDANQADVLVQRIGLDLVIRNAAQPDNYLLISEQLTSEAQRLLPINTIRFNDGVVHNKELREYTLSNVTAPASLTGLATAHIGYEFKNIGIDTFTEAVTAQLYLSSDHALDAGDKLLTTATLDLSEGLSSEELKAGSFDIPLSALQGSAFGHYHFIVKTTLPGAESGGAPRVHNAVSGGTVLQPSYHAVMEAPSAPFTAGTAVPLTGTALSTLNGAPAAFVPVTVEVIRNGGAGQTYSVLTDATGKFTLEYQTLDGLGGAYNVRAHHPDFAAEDSGYEDSFSVVDVNIQQQEITQTVNGGGVQIGSFLVNNPSAQAITGLVFNTDGLPEGWDITFSDLGSLGAGQSSFVQYNLTTPVENSTHDFSVNLHSNEGADDNIDFNITVRQVPASLVIETSELTHGVLRGAKSLVEFQIGNIGQETAHGVQVVLPNLPWMKLVSGGAIGDVLPGEVKTITLQLDPAHSEGLGHYAGDIIVRSIATDGHTVSTPAHFDWNLTSDRTGGLDVDLTDEYTYFSTGTPYVQDAVVRIVNATTGEQVLRLEDVDGNLHLDSLQEGTYAINISSANHSNYQSTVNITAGSVKHVEAFMPRQTVQYSWSVEQIEVEDRTHITVETTFETNVPVPVIVMDPPILEFSDIGAGETKVVNITITNHGLIGVKNIGLDLPDPENYTVEAAIDRLDTLAAGASIVVPVTITYNPPEEEMSLAARAPGSDGLFMMAATAHGAGTGSGSLLSTLQNACNGGLVTYYYDCGVNQIQRSDKISYSGVDCIEHVVANYVINAASTAIVTSPYYDTAVSFINYVAASEPEPTVRFVPNVAEAIMDVVCSDTLFGVKKDLLQAMLTKIDSFFILKPSLPGPVQVASNFLSILDQLKDMINGNPDDFGVLRPLINKIPGLANKFAWMGVKEALIVDGVPASLAQKITALLSQATSIKELVDVLKASLLQSIANGGHEDDHSHNSLEARAPGKEIFELAATAEGGEELTLGEYLSDERFDGILRMDEYVTRLQDYANIVTFSLGSLQWLDIRDFTGMDALLAYAQAKADAGEMITNVAEIPVPAGASPALMQSFVDRHNRTMEYYNQGKFLTTDLEPGDNPDFMAVDTMIMLYERLAGPVEDGPATAAQLGTYDTDLFNDVAEAVTELRIENLEADASNVCAKVAISIDQDAVMSRTAFLGSLDLTASAHALQNVQLDIKIYDAQGNLIEPNIFGVINSYLSGIEALDGTHGIALGATAHAEFTFLPSQLAALQGPTIYYIGGELSFEEEDHEHAGTFTLNPVEITVKPQAELSIDYFQQRDVIADDPFTDDTVESAVPFLLGVQVHNSGKGDANNLRIQSSQPQIVDNEKGLLVDFSLLGSKIDGQAGTHGLNAVFGTIGAGDTKTGVWYMQSSLQGKFLDYTASFQHVNSLGIPELSLVKEVHIHELIHGGDVDVDGKTDFLTNEVEDAFDTPDTLFLGNGTQVGVALQSAVETGFVASGATATSTITAGGNAAGWDYFSAFDAGAAHYKVASITRADGSQLQADRFWQTDRTFGNNQMQPVYEDKVHIIDDQNSASYTLHYQLVAGANEAPVLGTPIADDAAAEDGLFTLDVSGHFSDADGDLLTYMATLENGSALPAWLTFNATTGTFSGTPLNEHIGAVSVTVKALDGYGGERSDTFVLNVTNTNDAPLLLPAIADATTAEDAPFTLGVAAYFADIDAGDSLTYVATLQGGATLPAWLAFDALTGTFSGTPLNEHVGSLALSVTATDTFGASVSGDFTLTVSNTNDTPVLTAAIADQSATRNVAFAFTLPAGTFTDVDAGDVLTYVATQADGSALPTWLSFNSATRSFNGTATGTVVPGLISILVTATDGTGISASDLFVIDLKAGITHTGTEANNTINGSTGDDYIVGLGGSDKVYGKTGNDSIEGGSGNDILQGDEGSDTILGDIGTDSITGMAGADLLYGGAERDTIKGGTENDTLYGDAGNDILQGEAGNDSLVGGADSDSMNGGADDDVLQGDDGNDTVDGDEGNDVLSGGVGMDSLVGDGGTDLLEGGADNDTLKGGNDADTLFGDAGADLLYGDAGNDTLYGATEADKLYGGDGNDSLLGEDGNDTISGDNGDDTLRGASGADSLSGLAGADMLFGDEENDTLRGGNDNDTLYGGEGNDSLFGDAGDDILYGQAGNDTLTGGTEAATLDGGDGDDSLVGGALNDLLIGGDGNDILKGAAGNDTLLGGAGNDRIEAGDGEDGAEGDDALSINGNTGNDTITGGNGVDTLYGGADNDVIDGGAENDILSGDLGNDSILGSTGNDSIDGGAGNDTLRGSYDSDTLNGGTGADSLAGDAGMDVISGGEDNDSINGGTENDTLSGGAGNDTILGGTGNDILTGGAGVDSMDSNAGLDLFVFTSKGDSTAGAMDIITNFIVVDDTISLSGLGMVFADLAITYNSVTKITLVDDLQSDFQIALSGKITLTAADFIF